jgi:hypothetical protein
MEALKRPSRWVKSYWDDEDRWYFFEADEDGRVLRQVELQGLTQIASAYDAKQDELADQPMSEWDPGMKKSHEMNSKSCGNGLARRSGDDCSPSERSRDGGASSPSSIDRQPVFTWCESQLCATISVTGGTLVRSFRVFSGSAPN